MSEVGRGVFVPRAREPLTSPAPGTLEDRLSAIETSIAELRHDVARLIARMDGAEQLPAV
nr:hypothetical protein [Nonomuraea fuscirosea]